MISPVFRQFITIICCNLSTFVYGMQSGWATINFIDLQNVNTTFPAGALSLNEATLVVSLPSVGGLIGNFAMQPISEKCGTIRSIHSLSIPLICSVLLIIYGTNIHYLYISRILSGFVGGCVNVGVPNLAMDIASDKIRGALLSMIDPMFNFGVFFSFLLGNYIDCIDQVKVQIIPSAFLFFILFFFPDSPTFYMKRNNEIQAIKSTIFFNGGNTDTDLQQLKNAAMDQLQNDKLTIRDFLTPQSKRSILLSCIFSPCTYLCGVLVITSYVTAILTETGFSYVKSFSLFVPLVQLMTNLIFSYVIERFDRKTLFIWSSILTAIIYFLYGMYLMFWSNLRYFNWMSPLCISLIIFIGCLGLIPIPYIVSLEIYPKKIRSACIAPFMSLMWILSFVIGTVFPLMEATIGLSACMFGFGVICILCALIGFWLMPRTRGKSHDEIMTLLTDI